MEMSKGQVAYSFSGDKAELMLTPSIVKTGSKVSVRGSLAGKNFEMRITNVAFTESEEESTVPYSVSILGGEGSVNGGKGGCIRYADGTAPRDVIGVADNDVLNIRTKPNSRASVLGTAYPRGRVWIYPRSNAGGWIKASFYRFAESKSKRGLVTGWVNAKFLAKRKIEATGKLKLVPSIHPSIHPATSQKREAGSGQRARVST